MINQKFDYLYAENGRLKAVVVDKNGEPQVTDVTPDKPYSQSLITDGQGDTLVVSKKGQVMGVKEYKFAGDDRHLLNEYHRQLDSLGDWQINFKSAKDQTYAFDQIGSGNHGIFATDEYYPKSGSYDFRYKSVECGKNDRVVVDFGSYPEKDSVIFKDKYGVKLKVVDGNILTFTGVSKADTNYIYAYRGDKKIGKLFLNTYQPKKYQVVFVKVNKGAPKLKEKEVKEYLNKVYNQCAVQFEIISTDTITIKDLTTFSHGGSGILTVYNDDQKKVLRAYDNKMQDGIFYLFFIDNVTDKKDGNGTPVSGYMPRGYNAGFIYDGGSPHTIAHELGHGIAGLEHVFENSSNSGKTANLMDYASGSELWHFQWDQIQDPSRVWMKWNKAESEGENVEGDFIEFYIFSPWYANKVLSQKGKSFDEMKKQLVDLTNTAMPSEIKNIIANYKIIKSTPTPQHITNFLSFFQQSSNIAYSKLVSKLEDASAIQIFYLKPNGSVYEVSSTLFSKKDIKEYDNAPNNDFKEIYNDFMTDLKNIVTKRLDEGVWCVSLSANGKFAAYGFDIEGVSDVSDFSVNGGGYIEAGIVWDKFNVGLFGNLGLVFNSYLKTIYGTEVNKSWTSYETVKSLDNFCYEIGGGISGNISWFWRYDYLPLFFGVGHSKSLTIAWFSPSILYNEAGQRSGLGIGFGPKGEIPFGFSSLSSENYGFIMTKEEFLYMLNNCDINNSKIVKPHLDYPHSNGFWQMTDKAYQVYQNNNINF